MYREKTNNKQTNKIYLHKNNHKFTILFINFRIQLDEKITSADRNREKHQAEIKNKQKQREMRAARARERARKLEEAEGEELNFDVEKDETFNADDGRS